MKLSWELWFLSSVVVAIISGQFGAFMKGKQKVDANDCNERRDTCSSSLRELIHLVQDDVKGIKKDISTLDTKVDQKFNILISKLK